MKNFVSIQSAVMLASALAATSPAIASPVVGRFTFDNLCQDPSYCLSVSGKFLGDDIDQNGVIDKSELTYFYYNDNEYTHTVFPNMLAGVDSFSYTVNGPLAFSAGWWSSNTASTSIKTGESYKFYWRTWEDGTFSWNANTRESLNVVPVPEPAPVMMLAAGLGLLGWIKRRSRASSAGADLHRQIAA